MSDMDTRERVWLVVEAARRVTSEWSCSKAWEQDGDEAKSALCDAIAILDGREPEDELRTRRFLHASIGHSVGQSEATNPSSTHESA